MSTLALFRTLQWIVFSQYKNGSWISTDPVMPAIRVNGNLSENVRVIRRSLDCCHGYHNYKYTNYCHCWSGPFEHDVSMFIKRKQL